MAATSGYLGWGAYLGTAAAVTRLAVPHMHYGFGLFYAGATDLVARKIAGIVSWFFPSSLAKPIYYATLLACTLGTCYLLQATGNPILVNQVFFTVFGSSVSAEVIHLLSATG